MVNIEVINKQIMIYVHGIMHYSMSSLTASKNRLIIAYDQLERKSFKLARQYRRTNTLDLSAVQCYDCTADYGDCG